MSIHEYPTLFTFFFTLLTHCLGCARSIIFSNTVSLFVLPIFGMKQVPSYYTSKWIWHLVTEPWISVLKYFFIIQNNGVGKLHPQMNLGFVVPCIFKYSIKHPTRCTVNLIFIALSHRHRSTCFGHCCAHHQEPPPTAFAASGYRMIAGLDVFQTVVSLLVRFRQHTL
jgi:hypothetical protein